MSESRGWTRREALGMLGMGVAAAALPEFASAQTPAFPRGAVIRTVLKDYAPEELAGGATLFHEHMSFADDFMVRWTGYAADTRRATAMPGAAAPPRVRAARVVQPPRRLRRPARRPASTSCRTSPTRSRR